MLSIVTASHRNPAGLRALHGQLRGGLDDQLEWIIQDTGACAETGCWAEQLDQRLARFNAGQDTGIYDALNQALARARHPYYLVVGSDDSVDIGALRKIVSDLSSSPAHGADIITYPVRIDTRIRHRQPLWPGWANMLGVTASHSVGTVIRRGLHDSLGLYDTRYQLLADSLFLRRAQLAGARIVHRDTPVPGSFATTGASRQRLGRVLIENYTYNVECGSPRLFQAVGLVARLIAYRPRTLL